MNFALKSCTRALAVAVTLSAGLFVAPMPTAMAAEIPQLPFFYRVDKGDEIGYLAHVYGTTKKALLNANRLNSFQLHAGQILLITREHAETSAAVAKPLQLHLARKVSHCAEPSLGMLATAYDASPSSNGPWGAFDFFGHPLKFGDVAVDPSVITLGTKLFISGYTDPLLPKKGFYATAVDTGGAIVGHRLDIFLPGSGQASDFGMEQLKVTILR